MAGKADKPDLEQLLSCYIDGACSPQEREQVEQALQRDPRLRALHAELSRAVDAIRAVPGEAAPGHVRERTLAQLERRALLGEGPNPAATPDHTGRRGHPTAWLSLLAAAMLVAGVGVTWWIRMHAEKAPMQLAMAPTATPANEPLAIREIAPQRESGRTEAVAARKRAEGEGGKGYAMKVAEEPSVGVHVRTPAATPPPPPPPPPAPLAVAARPQPPVMADRSGEDPARAVPPPAPQSDRALAMAEPRGRAPSTARPEAVQSFGREIATNAAPAAPQVSLRSLRSEPAGAGAGSRLADEMGRPKEMPATDALAAAPASAGVTRAAGKDAVDLAMDEAASSEAPAAASAEPSAAAMAWVGSAGVHFAAGRSSGAAEPTVVQLQVGVRDASQQIALGDVIRSRVMDRGGQFASRVDQSVIPVADPTGWGLGLAAEIEQVSGVVYVRPGVLPASNPLARQASSLAAQQQSRQVARVAQDSVASAASGQAPTATPLQFSPDSHITFYRVPPTTPRQYVPLVTPMVIVLQPVAAAAASQPSSQ